MSFRIIVSTIGVLGLLYGSAHASPCTAGCGQQKRDCVQAARVAKKACKDNCRLSTDPVARRDCFHACNDSNKSAKTTCQANHSACIAACHGGSPSGAFTD